MAHMDNMGFSHPTSFDAHLSNEGRRIRDDFKSFSNSLGATPYERSTPLSYPSSPVGGTVEQTTIAGPRGLFDEWTFVDRFFNIFIKKLWPLTTVCGATIGLIIANKHSATGGGLVLGAVGGVVCTFLTLQIAKPITKLCIAIGIIAAIVCIPLYAIHRYNVKNYGSTYSERSSTIEKESPIARTRDLETVNH